MKAGRRGKAILGGKVVEGDVVVIATKGRKRAEDAGNALSDQFPEVDGAGQACALITDGRFSGGTSGLSIGHVSPEADQRQLMR